MRRMKDSKPVIRHGLWRVQHAYYQRRFPTALGPAFKVAKFALGFSVADYRADRHRCEQLLNKANAKFLGWIDRAHAGTLI